MHQRLYMAITAVYIWSVPSREHTIELWNIIGRCIYQQSYPNLPTYGFMCTFPFFRHQRLFIIPSILKYWETYRNSLIDLAKQTKDVVWCGDARFDSMGHCAKYGVYTFMSTTLMKIVHFELVQVAIIICLFCLLLFCL